MAASLRLATEGFRMALASGEQEGGMSKRDISADERIIANTINETGRGDPDALAARIVAALGEAGYHIGPANGIEGHRPRPPAVRQAAPRDAATGPLRRRPRLDIQDRRAWRGI